MQSATLVAIPRADARSASQAGAATGAVSSAGAVRGGMGGDLPEIFRAVDLSPLVVMLSVVTALALGAGHALTPGHGKTLMAAYLVGSRGSPVHAVGLGLAVTVSHTLGILVLAVLVVGSQELLPPEVVVRGAPVVAALAIVAIGSWMLIAELRRRFSAARVHGSADGLAHVHQHGLEDEHGHGEHSHGGVRHTHLPQVGSTITWRGLFALGLAGGLIPSTSALFILLGSIVAGRPAFGFVLVVVFGLGMAAVMTAVGLTMVFARGRLDRSASGSLLGRLARHATLVAAAVVLAVGVYLTAQALGRPIL
jgi:ABC-type nickel/cobalt efflux system permease component RcnA